MKKQNKRNIKENRIEKRRWVKLKDITQNPVWKRNEQKEEMKNSLSKIDECFCGSGKNHGDCCHGKTPLEILENHGYKVLRDIDGNVIVGLDKSYDFFEGINKKRSEPFESNQLYKIPMEKIKDYNSLWELTKSGWDSVGERVYPYIFLENGTELDAYRWDNSRFLRPKCLTHTWNEFNFQKFYKSDEFKWMLENQPKTTSVFHVPTTVVKKIGRNKKCICGSGLKFKKCCGQSSGQNQLSNNKTNKY